MSFIIQFLIFFLGASLASFSTLVGARLAHGDSVVLPASHCDYCRRRLRLQDRLPVLSFLLNAGQSYCCRQSLPSYYILLELLGGFLGIFCYYLSFQRPDQAAFLALLSFFAIAFTVSDLKSYRLPNSLMLAFALSSLAYLSIFSPQDLLGNSLCSLAIFCILLALYLVSPDSLGGGDVKLITCLTLLVGAKLALVTLSLATGLGLLAFIISWVTSRSIRRLPFAPFLFLGCFLALIVEQVFLYYN